MNTTHNRKKKQITAALGAAAAAVVAPAVLFGGAGTANAKTPATWVEFEPFTAGGDLTVVVHNNTPADFGQCRYVATPQGPSLLPPYISTSFHLGPSAQQTVYVGNYLGPGAVRTFTTWGIAINCDNGFFAPNVNGGNSNTFQF